VTGRTGRSGGHRRTVARIAVAVAAATVTATAAVLAGRSVVPSGEERLFRLLNDAPSHWWPLVWPTMQLGNRAAPLAIGAVVAVRTRRWRPVTAMLVAAYGAWAVALLLKDLIGRGRPEALLADVMMREPAEGLGFVSGHAAVAAAIAAAVWPHLDTRGRIAALTLATLVGAGRIYSGAHLPLDVVGGLALGTLIGVAVDTVDRSAGRRLHGAAC
jgi:membrane-associated phospholipid phosphatase